jgi:PIN domain nuclease of toxin-antitoxin system
LKLLVDTHVFLWAITADPRLSASHAKQFLDEANDLFLSVASLWEMLIKVGVGRLPLPSPPTEYLVRQMEKNRVSLLPIRTSHLTELEALPPLHRDPFDRMLIAQSRAEKMPLLTVDDAVRQYPVRIL